MAENGRISLLVVEDDQTHRELVAQCLRGGERPFDLVFAGSCGQAAALLASRAFECVLLDHNLPDGTGAALLRRARDALLTTPVVAFSTSSDPQVALAEFEGGCAAFVSKRDAFKGRTLARTIVEAMDRCHARAVLERAGSSASLVEQAGKLLTDGRERPLHERSVEDRLQLIYETAVRTIEDGVLLVERRNLVVYANPGFKRLLGLSEADDLPGHPRTAIDDVLAPDAADAFKTRDRQRGRYESALRSLNDGGGIPVMIAESPLGPNGVLCAVSDLREVKAQQLELERKNQRLAELNEMANRFVDNVSHEFRTPLTVIKGYTEVIETGLAGAVSDQQREFLRTILDRTRDMAQMVDDLLDTSRLRAGCLRVDRRPSRVKDMFKTLRTTIQQKEQVNQIAVREQLDEPLPEVYADGEKVGRIILNLVVNAIKFSPQGSEVLVWARAEGEGDVRIGVTDQGPGIAPEHLGMIFERFKQVGDPQRSSTKGFGLGLSIASELVALNLGAMHVESEPGRGSTFSFTLPRHDPGQILGRFMDRMADSGDSTIALLEVRPVGTAELPEKLRILLASHTQAMDLIFEAPCGGALLLVGLSGQPEAWVRRLREVHAEAMCQAPGGDLCDIDLRLAGQWPYPVEREAARAAIAAAMQGAELP